MDVKGKLLAKENFDLFYTAGRDSPEYKEHSRLLRIFLIDAVQKCPNFQFMSGFDSDNRIIITPIFEEYIDKNGFAHKEMCRYFPREYEEFTECMEKADEFMVTRCEDWELSDNDEPFYYFKFVYRGFIELELGKTYGEEVVKEEFRKTVCVSIRIIP